METSPSKRTKKTGEKTEASSSLASGFVLYNGSLLDVSKLMSQLKRSEDARIDTEKYLSKLRSENGHLKDQAHRSSNTIKDLSSELKDFKERLSNTNSELCNIGVKTKLYFNILQDIHDKVSPIVAIKEEKMDEDHAIEIVEMEDVQMEPVSKKETEVTKKESGGRKISHTREENAPKKERTEKKEETTTQNKSETKQEVSVVSKPKIEEVKEDKTENDKEVKDGDKKQTEEVVTEKSPEKSKDRENKSDENKDKDCKVEKKDE